MRSLTGVRARAERLAFRLQAPDRTRCPECRELDKTKRVVCYYGEAPSDAPTESRCRACDHVVCEFIIVVYDKNMEPPPTIYELQRAANHGIGNPSQTPGR